MNEQFKKSALQHALFIGLFMILSIILGLPAFQGNKLVAGDSIHWQAMSQEARSYYEKTGEVPLWTNAMFGGMPTYMHYLASSSNLLQTAQDGIQSVLQIPGFFFFLAMISFYVLMCSWKVNRWIGFFAAITYALAAYNFQIISAGHNTKMLSIGYMPLVLAGVHWVYQQKWITGISTTLLGLSVLVMAGMYQIDYYLMIVLVGFAIAYFIQALRENQLKSFFIGSAMLIAVAALAVLPNMTNLMLSKEYAAYTMRGGNSEVTLNKKEKKNNGGLNKDYAFQWSEGIGETFTLLVPNLYGGGGAVNVGTGSKTYEALTGLGVAEQNAEAYSQNVSTYWGDQPFLAGPVYFGALVIFFFVLSFFVVQNRLKWFILGIAMLGFMMAWGRHFPGLNYFMFDHLPFYNNFRTPSMSMVIPGFMFTLLAFWGLHEFFTKPLDSEQQVAILKKSFLITGGLCLILTFGSKMFLDFKGPNDDRVKERLSQQFGDNKQAVAQMYDALVSDRSSIATKDGLRSFAFILIAAVVLWLYATKKIKTQVAIIAIGLIGSIDLYTIGSRYLNSDNYISEEEFDAQFNARAIDNEVKKDPDPYYRVFDLTQDPYNEAMQAYHNKCVGGYHPAKMETYQDLIDLHLSNGKMNREVLNMLNTKYIFFNGANNQPGIQPNSAACGNAWFVKNIRVVQNADEEITALTAGNFGDTAKANGNFVAKETAVIQSKHWKNPSTSFVVDSSSKISLNPDGYGLNKLSFTSNNSQAGFAVFSDIYYPAGWKAFIDGKEQEIVKTNYLLRGLMIPAGKHSVEFKFHPDTYFKWKTISQISSTVILILIALGLALTLKQSLKPEPDA